MLWELLFLQTKLFLSTWRTKCTGITVRGKDLKSNILSCSSFLPTWEDQDPFPWVVSPLPRHSVCLLHSFCKPSGNMAGSIRGNTWVRSAYCHDVQTPLPACAASFHIKQTFHIEHMAKWALNSANSIVQLHLKPCLFGVGSTVTLPNETKIFLPVKMCVLNIVL